MDPFSVPKMGHRFQFITVHQQCAVQSCQQWPKPENISHLGPYFIPRAGDLGRKHGHLGGERGTNCERICFFFQWVGLDATDIRHGRLTNPKQWEWEAHLVLCCLCLRLYGVGCVPYSCRHHTCSCMPQSGVDHATQGTHRAADSASATPPSILQSLWPFCGFAPANRPNCTTPPVPQSLQMASHCCA